MSTILSSTLNKVTKLPITIISLIVLISCFGFLLMYSAAQGNMNPWALKQIIHFSLFAPLMLVIGLTNLKFWYKASYVFYYGSLILLFLIYILGYTAMGATRWIDLGSIKLQPSELMKICIIFALARYFHDLEGKKIYIKDLIAPIVMLIIPAFLIIKQPDLGTAIILLSIGVIIFFVANVSKWFFISAGIGLSVTLPIIWQFLYDYQKKRVLNFLNPEQDKLGSGYNIIQSKIAIGSGGFFGKGFMQGSQSQLEFLPEHQTDFIFTMISEEWGFFGASLVLLLFTILICYGYLIAFHAKSQYGRILAMGSISIISLHVIINVAMVMGLLPAVGIPFPLLSYGGTNMMTVLISFGLIISVHIHSQQIISNYLKSLF